MDILRTNYQKEIFFHDSIETKCNKRIRKTARG